MAVFFWNTAIPTPIALHSPAAKTRPYLPPLPYTRPPPKHGLTYPHCPNTVGAGVVWSGVGAFMAARPWGSYARSALLVGLLNLLQRLLLQGSSNLHPVFLHSRANNKDKEQEQEQHGLRKEERVKERASHVE